MSSIKFKAVKCESSWQSRCKDCDAAPGLCIPAFCTPLNPWFSRENHGVVRRLSRVIHGLRNPNESASHECEKSYSPPCPLFPWSASMLHRPSYPRTAFLHVHIWIYILLVDARVKRSTYIVDCLVNMVDETAFDTNTRVAGSFLYRWLQTISPYYPKVVA